MDAASVFNVDDNEYLRIDDDEYLRTSKSRKNWLTIHSLTMIRFVHNQSNQQRQQQQKGHYRPGSAANIFSLIIDWNNVALKLDEIFTHHKIPMKTKPDAKACSDKWHALLSNARRVRTVCYLYWSLGGCGSIITNDYFCS
jgi:hypothetical protein